MTALGRWSPLSVDELAAALAAYEHPWWIAGGWAIDLFVGRRTREHHDIDVAVRRSDQHALQELLVSRGWEPHVAASGMLTPWLQGDELQVGRNNVWCRRSGDEPWRFEVLFAEADGAAWTLRGDPRIQLPLAEMTRHTEDGTPFVAPAVQLLFKARHRKPHDDADLQEVLPRLHARELAWLRDALKLAEAPDHPWVLQLEAA